MQHGPCSHTKQGDEDVRRVEQGSTLAIKNQPLENRRQKSSRRGPRLGEARRSPEVVSINTYQGNSKFNLKKYVIRNNLLLKSPFSLPKYPKVFRICFCCLKVFLFGEIK